MATNNATNTQNPLGIKSGGTSSVTLSNHAILVGHSTSVLTSPGSGVNGSVIIGATGSTPATANITSTLSSIALSTNVNALNLDVTAWTNTTWTPALKFGGNSVALTYSTQSGLVRRVGKTSFITAAMVLTAKGSSTGAVTITGLPAGSNSVCCLNLYFSNLTYTGQIMTHATNISTTLNLTVSTGTGAAANLTNTAFANNSVIIISGTILTV